MSEVFHRDHHRIPLITSAYAHTHSLDTSAALFRGVAKDGALLVARVNSILGGRHAAASTEVAKLEASELLYIVGVFQAEVRPVFWSSSLFFGRRVCDERGLFFIVVIVVVVVVVVLLLLLLLLLYSWRFPPCA